MRRTLFLYGATCLLGQVLALRELAVVFHGNELVYGVVLACWLLLFAAGSAVLGRAVERFNPGVVALAATLAACGLLAPLTIAAARAAQRLTIGSRGITPGFGTTVVATLLVLAPLCLALGLFYALACSVALRGGEKPPAAATRVYVFEAFGTFAAGVFFTFFFVRMAGGFVIALALAATNCLAAFAILRHRRGRGERAAGWTFLGMAVLLGVVAFSPLGTILDFASQALRFPGRVLLATEDTPHGRVDAAEVSGRVEFYQTGVLTGTTDTPSAAEEAALLGLLAHPAPKRALLIGGTASGLPAKALLLPWLRVDCVELDGELVAMARRYANEDDQNALDSDRVRLIANMDGRRFVKGASDRYDAIVTALPPPTTGMINRFYTVEFFEEARCALHEHGVLALRLDGKPDYMSAPHRALAESVHRSLRSVFPSVAAVPLDDAILFVASSGTRCRPEDLAVWPGRMARWNPDTAWLTPGKVAEAVRPSNLARATEMLRESHRAALNRDLRPIAYFHALRLWTEAFQTMGRRLLQLARGLDLKVLGLALVLLCGLLCAALLVHDRPVRLAVPATRLLTGLSSFVFQMVLIFAFQSLYGYVYSRIAVLFAVFMLGLVAGAAAGRRLFAGSELKAVMLFQVCLAVIVAMTAPLLRLLAGAGPTLSGVGAVFFIPTLNFLAGAAAGVQYPLCVTAWSASPGGPPAAGGIAARVYAMEMTGACAGAAIGGTVLLPVLGLTGACLLTALVCLASVPPLLIADWRRGW